jgi:hypothetical protein
MGWAIVLELPYPGEVVEALLAPGGCSHAGSAKCCSADTRGEGGKKSASRDYKGNILQGSSPGV